MIRPYSANEVDEIGPRIAFDVEFDGWSLAVECGDDVVHVVRFDVPLVGARVDSDAMDARAKAYRHRVEHAGLIAAARVAEGGDLVDVDG